MNNTLNPTTVFDTIFNFIECTAVADLDWPEIAEAIAAAKRKRLVTLSALPVLMSAATGGRVEAAIPLGASWVLYNLASDLFDDLQDRDGKDHPWNNWSVAQATNVGLGLIAAAQRCLAHLQGDASTLTDIIKSWSYTLANAAQGQQITQPIRDTTTYFNHLIAKSGLIVASVAQAGVRLNTTDAATLQAAHTFGMNVGLIIQIIDDCGDLLPHRSNSDLANRTYTLPVIHALSQTDDPRHKQLTTLLQSSMPLTSTQVEMACRLLDEMGAISYSLAVAKVHQQVALEALDAFGHHPATAHLKDYVCQLDPIQRIKSIA